jgi:CheY-like chemotaxis protein
LIVGDDLNTSLKYKRWLQEEGFESTLKMILMWQNKTLTLKIMNLVLIGFRMSVIDGFDLYNKFLNLSKKVQQDTSRTNDFRVCFMTSSRINHKVLAEIHPEFGQECYVSKEVPKDDFIKHVHSLVS